MGLQVANPSCTHEVWMPPLHGWKDHYSHAGKQRSPQLVPQLVVVSFVDEPAAEVEEARTYCDVRCDTCW